MDYEQGLKQLKQHLRNTSWEQEFLVYELRLRDNLYREQLYGSNEQIRSDRAQIIDQLNHLAQHVNRDFNTLCSALRSSSHAPFGDKKQKVCSQLRDIENAILAGSYSSAYREVLCLLRQATEELATQEAARLKYLEALVHLSGKRPCKHAPSVVKQAEVALQDACRLHNLASYKMILALLKDDFARTGVQVKKHRDEAYKLASQARRLPLKNEDREVIALFTRCHPQLSREYSHLLTR
jgi:hypothetical protein